MFWPCFLCRILFFEQRTPQTVPLGYLIPLYRVLFTGNAGRFLQSLFPSSTTSNMRPPWWRAFLLLSLGRLRPPHFHFARFSPLFCKQNPPCVARQLDTFDVIFCPLPSHQYHPRRLPSLSKTSTYVKFIHLVLALSYRQFQSAGPPIHRASLHWPPNLP